jgi:hypothetical protein
LQIALLQDKFTNLHWERHLNYRTLAEGKCLAARRMAWAAGMHAVVLLPDAVNPQSRHLGKQESGEHGSRALLQRELLPGSSAYRLWGCIRSAYEPIFGCRTHDSDRIEPESYSSVLA